jgi:hypothetical protein
MVEIGEARKGAAVRLTFDVGGIPGWRRLLGHPTWERGPSPTDAATAFEIQVTESEFQEKFPEVLS